MNAFLIFAVVYFIVVMSAIGVVSYRSSERAKVRQAAIHERLDELDPSVRALSRYEELERGELLQELRELELRTWR